jgi:hypothetical protein
VLESLGLYIFTKDYIISMQGNSPHLMILPWPLCSWKGCYIASIITVSSILLGDFCPRSYSFPMHSMIYYRQAQSYHCYAYDTTQLYKASIDEFFQSNVYVLNKVVLVCHHICIILAVFCRCGVWNWAKMWGTNYVKLFKKLQKVTSLAFLLDQW